MFPRPLLQQKEQQNEQKDLPNAEYLKVMEHRELRQVKTAEEFWLTRQIQN